MATTLSPLPILGFRDNNGNALVNGQLFTYQAGTQTPAPTYTDSTGVTQNPNPVILNARGEAQVWIPPNTAYKYVLTDAFGNTIWTVDQVNNAQLITLYGGVDTGSPNAYALSFTAAFSTLANGIVVYWVPSNTNTSASTIAVNGLGVIALTNPGGSALTAGQITAGQPVQMMYYNGSWVLLNGTFISGNATVGGNLLVDKSTNLGSAAGSGVSGWGPTLASYVDMTPDSGTFTVTYTGFSGTVTGIANWSRIGTTAVIVFPSGTGTSNAATFTATGLPAVLNTGLAQTQPAIYVLEDSGTIVATANVVFGVSSTTVTFSKNGNPSGWTNSGTKGVLNPFSVTYSLI